MNSLLEKKIVVCCGSGGVGKTTVAAAIAQEAARQGKRAVVLTIDPAKRLATALGLNELTDQPRRVPCEGSSGLLFAMMLDTKRTFDRLIEKYTPSAERRKAIFENRLYQHLSGMIAGSQEYMAMERLYELFHEEDYDLLVLDTPPTRRALDFLEAPQKMVGITSESILTWFLKPGLFASRIGLGALQKGADKILAVFDRLAGFSFLHELSEMLGLVAGLLGGFRDRAKAVYNLLREDFVGFILVTSPERSALKDSLYFLDKIRQGGLPFSGFVINRSHADFSSASEPEEASRTLREKLRENFEDYRRLGERDRQGIGFLRKKAGRGPFYKVVPHFAEDVHDLEGLERIGAYLFGGGI